MQAPVSRAIEALDLAGKRVLDIGCRDGLFSFLAERRGAAEVLGIDNDLSPAAVEFIIPALESRVKMYLKNVLDLTVEDYGRFNLVIFAGVLYHLRFPFLGLKRIRDVMAPDGMLIMETAVYNEHDDVPLLYCPIDTDNPYEPTSVTYFNRKGLTDTLLTFGFDTLSFDFLSGNKPVDRATLVCRYLPDLVPDRLRQYWEGTHANHSRIPKPPSEVARAELTLRRPS